MARTRIWDADNGQWLDVGGAVPQAPAADDVRYWAYYGTASFGGLTDETEIASLPDVTLPAGAYAIHMAVNARVSAGSGDNTILLALKRDGATMREYPYRIATSNREDAKSFTTFHNDSGGTHTFSLTIDPRVGASSLDVVSSGDKPVVLLIERLDPPSQVAIPDLTELKGGLIPDKDATSDGNYIVGSDARPWWGVYSDRVYTNVIRSKTTGVNILAVVGDEYRFYDPDGVQVAEARDGLLTATYKYEELLNSNGEVVRATRNGSVVTIWMQTSKDEGTTIYSLPSEWRPASGDLHAQLMHFTSGGSVKSGEVGSMRVRGVNGALFLAGVPSSYNPGSDRLRGQCTFTVGARGG